MRAAGMTMATMPTQKTSRSVPTVDTERAPTGSAHDRGADADVHERLWLRGSVKAEGEEGEHRGTCRPWKASYVQRGVTTSSPASAAGEMNEQVQVRKSYVNGTPGNKIRDSHRRLDARTWNIHPWRLLPQPSFRGPRASAGNRAQPNVLCGETGRVVQSGFEPTQSAGSRAYLIVRNEQRDALAVGVADCQGCRGDDDV